MTVGIAYMYKIGNKQVASHICTHAPCNPSLRSFCMGINPIIKEYPIKPLTDIKPFQMALKYILHIVPTVHTRFPGNVTHVML